MYTEAFKGTMRHFTGSKRYQKADIVVLEA